MNDEQMLNMVSKRSLLLFGNLRFMERVLVNRVNNAAPARLCSSIEQAVLNHAQADYEYLIENARRDNSAFFISCPDAFDYAIEHEHFSQDQIAVIRDTIGQTLESYCAEHENPDLLDDLRRRLLNPQKRLHYG